MRHVPKRANRKNLAIMRLCGTLQDDGKRAGYNSDSEGRAFESHQAYHVGAKSALLRRLFMPTAEKDVIRTLPCSSFSKLNPLTLGFNLVSSFLRTSYRSRRRFFFQNNRHRSFTPSLLLLQIEPTSLGFNLGFSFLRTSYRSRRRFFF